MILCRCCRLPSMVKRDEWTSNLLQFYSCGAGHGSGPFVGWIWSRSINSDVGRVGSNCQHSDARYWFGISVSLSVSLSVRGWGHGLIYTFWVGHSRYGSNQVKNDPHLWLYYPHLWFDCHWGFETPLSKISALTLSFKRHLHTVICLVEFLQLIVVEYYMSVPY